MNCENCLKFWLKQMEFICQNVEVKRFTFLYRHDINCPRIFSIGNHKTVKYVKERILFNSILNQTKCDLDILHLDTEFTDWTCWKGLNQWVNSNCFWSFSNSDKWRPFCDSNRNPWEINIMIFNLTHRRWKWLNKFH